MPWWIIRTDVHGHNGKRQFRAFPFAETTGPCALDRIIPAKTGLLGLVTLIEGHAGAHETTGFQAALQESFQIITASENLSQINAIGQGPMRCPDRHPVGQCEITHRGPRAELAVGRPAALTAFGA